MSTYLYELPTTGAAVFSDFCLDQTGQYAAFISETTQTRANLRAALKESKRTDGEKDYLKIVKIIDDYLPCLTGIHACVDATEILLTSEPIFSWRSTLSANFFHNSPRQSISSLHADTAFTLLTYAFALCNLARSKVNSLGTYERERSISDSDRKIKDEELNHAVMLLCKASGVFRHINEKVLPEWDNRRHITGLSPVGGDGIRPPDVTQEVTSALSKMTLADAQTLAIRKLLSKSAFDSTLIPGPPLPKSHPSPALIAKLYFECASLYSSARSLAKTRTAQNHGEDVAPELRRYLANESQFCDAVARKWIGIDAGENGGLKKGGEALGFLIWAKDGLEELKDGGRGAGIAHKGKDVKKKRKGKVAEEMESLQVFLKHYKTMNDSLNFQRVPPISELQASIPAGRSAVAIRPYVPLVPAFGPGSIEHTRRQTENLDLDSQPATDDTTKADMSTPTYAGAGSYF